MNPNVKSGPPALKMLSRTPKADPADEPAPQERTGTAMVEPHMVGYRDGAETCGTCGNYSSGQCELLDMPVEAAGGCSAWMGGSGPSQDREAAEGGADSEMSGDQE